MTELSVEWIKGQSLIISSDDFTLKNIESDNISDNYISWLNDQETIKYISSRNTKNDKRGIENYISKFNNESSFHLGIYENAASKHIGNYSIYCDLDNKTASTNVLIGEKDWWGTGAVLSTREMVIHFLFENMNMYKITGTPMSRNTAAVFNYKKQGFKLEGNQREQIKLLDGSRSDLLYFGLLRSEFKSRFI